MKLAASTSRTPGSPTGAGSPSSHISASQATRYLSAAAHLRRPMLPKTITEPGRLTPRPPVPVGRAYARRVLRNAQGAVPVSAVDIDEVKRHCRIAVWQTCIRDGAAITALIVSAFLEPWGTVVTFGLVVAVIVLAGRVRLFSPLTLAATLGLVLALLTGGRREEISLAIPLIGLVICFFIYLTDTLLSARQVRRIWRQSSARQASPPPDRVSSTGPADSDGYQRNPAFGFQHWPATSTNEAGGSRPDHLGNGSGKGKTALPATGLERVYYDKHGIAGAGAALPGLTLTIPLDKARPKTPSSDGDVTFPGSTTPAAKTMSLLAAPHSADGETIAMAEARTADGTPRIKSFTASELVADISAHIKSMGAGDGQVHGLAYGPVPTGNGQIPALEPGHFTYGLPYLEVCKVVAEPLPKAKKHPVSRLSTVPLEYRNPPTTKDFGAITDRSPSEHPKRHYLRISSASWDGQLVVSIYLNAALQGHFLRLVMRPYVLAPNAA